MRVWRGINKLQCLFCDCGRRCGKRACCEEKRDAFQSPRSKIVGGYITSDIVVKNRTTKFSGAVAMG